MAAVSHVLPGTLVKLVRHRLSSSRSEEAYDNVRGQVQEINMTAWNSACNQHHLQNLD